jgi:hypothetical protein
MCLQWLEVDQLRLERGALTPQALLSPLSRVQ